MDLILTLQASGYNPRMEQIFFTDNFFLLRNRIQVLHELLELEVNADIFNPQIIEEVRNITQLLEHHEELLNQRNQLQGFAELAHQLFRIKHAFIRFLRSSIHSPKTFLQQLIDENSDEWHNIINKISNSNEKLAEEFHNYAQSGEDENSMVSDAELELLFQSQQELGEE